MGALLLQLTAGIDLSRSLVFGNSLFVIVPFFQDLPRWTGENVSVMAVRKGCLGKRSPS